MWKPASARSTADCYVRTPSVAYSAPSMVLRKDVDFLFQQLAKPSCTAFWNAKAASHQFDWLFNQGWTFCYYNPRNRNKWKDMARKLYRTVTMLAEHMLTIHTCTYSWCTVTWWGKHHKRKAFGLFVLCCDIQLLVPRTPILCPLLGTCKEWSNSCCTSKELYLCTRHSGFVGRVC